MPTTPEMRFVLGTHRNKQPETVFRRVGLRAYLVLACAFSLTSGSLLIAFQPSALAQLVSGPGFDPTPVEIPNVQKAALRPVTSMDLLTLRDFHGTQISPDGKWVAFVLGQAVYDSNSYRSGMFVISTEKGGKPICLGSAGPPHWDDVGQWWSEDPQWSADSKSFYYRMKSGETWQVWKWSREGGPPVQVTHIEHNLQSYLLTPGYDKLFLTVEKASAIDRKQLAEHGFLYDGSFEAGDPMPFLDQIAQAKGVETEIWVHDFKDGHDRKATDEETDAYGSFDDSLTGKIYGPKGKLFTAKEIEDWGISEAKISPDGKRVAYGRALQDPSESKYYAYPLYSRPVEGGPSVVLTPNIYIDQFWWSADSKEIYYNDYKAEASDDPRPSKLIAVPATGGKARTVADLPGAQYGYSVDQSVRLLACLHENSTTPDELEFVDMSTGETRILVNVNPEFQNIELSPARRIDVTNKYGDHFWSHLVLPLNYEAGERYPLIVTTYRDGDVFLRGGTGDEYPIQVFAANGFAVLNFDVGPFRTSKPGDFEAMILFWDSPIEGMRAAIEKAVDMGFVDPARVAVTGLSHGSEMVKYAVSHTNLFRAAIASGPSWEPMLYEATTDFYRQYMSRTYHLESPDGEARVRWQRTSAALNADRIPAALLINAADSEYLTDLELLGNLRELKKPVEMFIYPNEFHEKNQPKHRYEIYQRNVDWMKFWLNKEENPDPAKAEQYARWRKLRSLQDEVPAQLKKSGTTEIH
jgi:dipeptidyl aminopeptidase/acylaminoacyl peptidase